METDSTKAPSPSTQPTVGWIKSPQDYMKDLVPSPIGRREKNINPCDHLRISHELMGKGGPLPGNPPTRSKNWTSSDVSPYGQNFVTEISLDCGSIKNYHNKLHREGEVRNPDVNKAKVAMEALSIFPNVGPQQSTFHSNHRSFFRTYYAIFELGQITRPWVKNSHCW